MVIGISLNYPLTSVSIRLNSALVVGYLRIFWLP